MGSGVVSRIWAFHNTLLLAASLGAVFFLAQTPFAHALVRFIGEFGYVGGAVSGIFFVSTFTVAPAAIVLFHLAEELNPVVLALCAGFGSVIGDLILFRFLKDRVFEELAPLTARLTGSHLGLMLKTPYFAWFAPVLGALIIASPFPDELGISLLGLSKINTVQFIALTYVLNVTGILAIVLIAQA